MLFWLIVFVQAFALVPKYKYFLGNNPELAKESLVLPNLFSLLLVIFESYCWLLRGVILLYGLILRLLSYPLLV